MLRRMVAYALLSVMVITQLGCSHTKKHPNDPLEVLNREIFGLNKTLDKTISKPVAYIYLQYLPQPIQSGIGNFFDNIREVTTVGNDLLQGKFGYASHDASRFLINTTIGVFGIFDPASSFGLEHRKEDFGQTLYAWGYKNSSYLVLPLVGPSTIRDAIGLGVDYSAFSIWPWIRADWKKYALLSVDYVDLRARFLGRETVLDVLAVDEYVFIRDAYFQRREYLGKKNKDRDEDIDIYDGDIPIVNDVDTKPEKSKKEHKEKAKS